MAPSSVREVCDGVDVTTDVGVLHFASMPTADDIAAAVASLTAPEVVPMAIVQITAEDGEVL